MNRRRARHYVESPDRWAEQSRGRIQAEAICTFEAVTRAMLPFPRGESWGVNKLAPGSEGKPSWWSSLPETFTIHSTYFTETRPSADKSGARARRGAPRCDAPRRTYLDAISAAYTYQFAAVHGFSLPCVLRFFVHFDFFGVGRIKTVPGNFLHTHTHTKCMNVLIN